MLYLFLLNSIFNRNIDMQSSNSTISLLGGNGVNLENGLIEIIFYF